MIFEHDVLRGFLFDPTKTDFYTREKEQTDGVGGRSTPGDESPLQVD
ncbi:MAG: hypothetical protein VXW32_07695 [Myxococcota bacterium]|nr:hypothetical protein [Myxococcota bacterium]